MQLDDRRLRQSLDSALDWLDVYLEYFDPARSQLQEDSLSRKMLLELTLMCMVHRRALPDSRDQRIDSFIELARKTFERDEIRHLIVRQPQLYRLHGMTALALIHCGASDSDRQLEALVRRTLCHGYTAAIEELPFRDLERVLMHGWLGLHADAQGQRTALLRAYGRTLTARSSDIMYFTDYDVYALTHTLFYLGDFGSADVTGWLGAGHARLCELTEVLLGLYLRKQDWDLTAELVLSCHCLRWYPARLMTHAVESLLAAQRNDGSVPGPHFSSEKMHERPLKQQESYYVKHNYHTTLVVILAFLSLLTRNADEACV